MIPVIFLRFYFEQTHVAETLKRRDCRQHVWKLLLGDSLNSLNTWFQPKIWDSLLGTRWLGLGLDDTRVPCLFRLWLPVCCWKLQFLVVTLFPQVIVEAIPAAFPSRRYCSWDRGPCWLAVLQSPSDTQTGNEVNPGVLLLCKPWHPGPSLYHSSPSLWPSLDQPGLFPLHNLLVWHSQGLDLARKVSGPLLRRDWESLISPVLFLHFLCHAYCCFPCNGWLMFFAPYQYDSSLALSSAM